MARRRSKRQKRRMLIWTLVLLAAALLPVGIRALRPAPDAALAGETREAAFPLSALRFEDLPPYDGQLVIELDGSQHYEHDGMAHDLRRTEELESLGLAVLRFTNTEIDAEFPAVCACIDRVIRERTRDA